MAYAGTNDLYLVYSDYGSLMGTAAVTSFLSAGAEWLNAEFWAHEMTPPPVDPIAGTYDYWIRRANACQTIYMAMDSLLSERTEAGEDAWWSRYGSEAAMIVADIRSGHKRLSYQAASWQDTISPAIPWAYGTVLAPPTNVLHSSARVGGRYTDNIPRLIEIEIDALGSTLDACTFTARLAGNSVDTIVTGEPCDTDGWTPIGWGVSVLWTQALTGTVELGDKWRIYCTPTGEDIPSAGGARSKIRQWG